MTTSPAERVPLPGPRNLATPRREELLADFHRDERRARVRVGVELLLALGLLVWSAGRAESIPAWQSVVLFTAGALGVFDFLVVRLAERRKPLAAIADDATFGPHTGASLRAAVADVRRRMGLGDRECPVALVPDKEINAMALRVGLLPGLHGLQAVELNRSILHLLDEDELKFVIGHELGHVFRHGSLVHRSLAIHALLAGAVSLAVGLSLAGHDWMIGAPLVGLGVARWFWARGTAAGSQRDEFLCDECGAGVAGIDAATRALLKMGIEQEARGALVRRVMEAKLADETIPMKRLLEAYEAALPYGGVVPVEAQQRVVERVRRLRDDQRGLSLSGLLRAMLGGDDTDLESVREEVARMRRADGVARTAVPPGEALADPRRVAACLGAIEAAPERVLFGVEDEIDDSGSGHPCTSRRLLHLHRDAAHPPVGPPATVS